MPAAWRIRSSFLVLIASGPPAAATIESVIAAAGTTSTDPSGTRLTARRCRSAPPASPGAGAELRLRSVLAPAVVGGVPPQRVPVGVMPSRRGRRSRRSIPSSAWFSVRPSPPHHQRPRAATSPGAGGGPRPSRSSPRPGSVVASPSRTSSSASRRKPSNGVPSSCCSQTIRRPRSRCCSGSRPAPPALARLQHLRPPAAADRRALDVLDPARPRPPARQAVGVGDQRPDLGRRARRSRALRVTRGIRGRPSCRARRRRSRTSSRCLRWLTVAARLSRLSSASLRRSGLRERSDGAEQRFEQVRLAVGRGAEDAQVAAADAEPRELVGGADDLAVGLVVDRLALALLRLDDPEVLELGDQLLAGAGLLDHLVEGQVGARGVDEDRPPRARRAARRSPSPLAADRRPPASSWRITRSGRNSSRCRRRIVRSRSTSDWL